MFRNLLKRLRKAEVLVLEDGFPDVDALLDQKLQERHAAEQERLSERDFVQKTFALVAKWVRDRADKFQQRGYAVGNGADAYRVRITSPSGESIEIHCGYGISVDSTEGEGESFYPMKLRSFKSPEKAADAVVKSALRKLP